MRLALWSYQSPAHVGVAKAAASFGDVHCILRAPKGDGYGTIMLQMFERLGVTGPLSVCAMSEATLAGAPANITATIREVDRRLHPAMIVVTRSATASVLQEPLDGEIGTLQPGEVNAEIFLASAHPVRDSETSAFALTVREIVAHFAHEVRKSQRPSVNVIGPSLLGFHDRSNVESLRKLFDAVGVELNAVVPLGATPDDLRTIGRAWVNVAMAHELARPTLEYLRERFGTPWIEELPYGEAGTIRFLRELCGLCELSPSLVAEATRDARLLWYSRTVDAHALSGKRVGVFGTPTTAAGIARALREELDMEVEFAGTYVPEWAAWMRERLTGVTDDVLVTGDYREVARKIDETRPDIVFGSQMERHSASAFGVPCAVVSPPAHILNFPLGYAPFVGADGANHLGDLVNQTQVLGLEHHLIETFGPRGQGRFAEAAPEPAHAAGAPEPVAASAASAASTNGSSTPSGNGAAAGHAPSAGNGATAGNATSTGATAAEPAAGEPVWDAAAERLLGRVPFFVRKKARANVERYARERGIATIDEGVLLRAREHVGG